MTTLSQIYRHPLVLLTDLYQLTMAYGYWKSGIAEREAVFHLFFRKAPFRGQYAVAAGLAEVVDFVEQFAFDSDQRDYLATLTGNDGKPLFEPAFLEALGEMRMTCDIDAIPEGTVVFGQEPLVRVQGPIWQCQLLETPLLNLINFPTLIATKAARICRAAGNEPVLEFGVRRAQGVDGGLSASRAAYIGGCDSTSNLLAGKLYDIPVKGTHAHSWVMCFGDEREAFHEYAKALPNNCVFLVDTYDTLQGVRNAIEAGRWLRENGHEMVGIRLDSGDLAELSMASRKLLDEAGFPQARIVASNDLDEYQIEMLHKHGAQITVWGVGTRLATGGDQAALGGVYKLAAVRERDPETRQPGPWQHRIKLSEQSIKTTNPGLQQVRRFSNDTGFVADVIYETDQPPETDWTLVPFGQEASSTLPPGFNSEDLLVPIFRHGKRVYDPPSAREARDHRQSQIDQLPDNFARLNEPETYPVGLEQSLHQLKLQLMQEAKARISEV